ncbi:MAG: 6-hydroxymethylpterin diphosphokinase MptE-like protein [Campylobacterota bacterium]
MERIQEQAIQTFQNNLTFFKEHHKHVYDKISILQEAIEQGNYRENYALEYRDGYFDVKELSSGYCLYNQSSLEHARTCTEQVSMNKTESVLETFYNFEFSENAAATAAETDPTKSSYATTAPVIRYVHEVAPKDKPLLQIYKYIFLGTGLGVHMAQIHQKIKSHMYLFIENNLEIFRLSLFVTDYSSAFGGSELHFCIADTPADFRERFNRFFHIGFLYNNYLKFSLFSDAYAHLIPQLQSFIASQSHLTYSHHRLLEKNARVLRTMEEGYRFLNLSNHHCDTVFSEKPVLLVAPGPSLDKNIEWLKSHHDQFIIVCVLNAVKALEKHAIVPHVVVHGDESEFHLLQTFARLENPDFLKDAFFILTPSIPMHVFTRYYKKEQIFLFEERTRYKQSFGHLEGFSVGELTYALCLLFDARSLYLLGLDLALDPETGRTHAGDHHNDTTLEGKNTLNDKNVLDLFASTMPVKGNFLATVFTTPLFEMSLHRMEYFTRLYKSENQHVYNLNNGAFFYGTLPTKVTSVEEFTSLDQTLIHSRLESFFHDVSSSRLTPEESKQFDIRREHVQRTLEIITNFSESNVSSLQLFFQEYSKMVSQLVQSSGDIELAQIFTVYLEYISGYIGEFINSKNIDNPKRHTKKLQKIVVAQLLKLHNHYQTSLNNAELAIAALAE